MNEIANDFFGFCLVLCLLCLSIGAMATIALELIFRFGYDYKNDPVTREIEYIDCPECGGYGQIPGMFSGNPCPTCDGQCSIPSAVKPIEAADDLGDTY
jgi:RecJ-like exonuclease